MKPQPTYVEFPLLGQSQEFLRLFVTIDLGLPEPKYPFHVTTVYSKEPIDYQIITGLPTIAYEAPPELHRILLLQGNNQLGLCLTLAVNCGVLYHSHQKAMDLGASWDYPLFQPHITLAYGLELKDLLEKPLSTPNCPLWFGEERIMKLDEDWKPIRIQ